MENPLDFICIGAAKSGTTTLFELIKDHPQLTMPSAKEVPFYSDETVYKKGLDWYLQTYFAETDPDVLRGTITPQYMLGEDSATPTIIAERIQQDMPGVKLIAILRHPIERAYSHFKMSAQRGHLPDDFSETIKTLLANKQLDKLRDSDITITNNFLFGSEYGHELKPYYDRFAPENILVLFTDELKSDPQKTLDKVFEFLGIDSYTPPTLGQEFRKGGEKAKLAFLKPGNVYKIPFVKTLWKNYTPYAFRKKVEYSINLWNIKPGKEKLSKDSETYQALVEFYKPDIRVLESLIGQAVPWQDWQR